MQEAGRRRVSRSSRPARQCAHARGGCLLRSPCPGEPLAQDEARRDPSDRRRGAAPVLGLGRRGRPPEPVAARGDRSGSRGQQRDPGARGAGVDRTVRGVRARRRAHRRRDGMDGVVVTSPRKFPRTARVNEVMLEVLADELERMSDPRLELVTLTGVAVTRDLAYATVYYSTLGATVSPDAPPSFADDAGNALRKAATHLRGVGGRQMRIRQDTS